MELDQLAFDRDAVLWIQVDELTKRAGPLVARLTVTDGADDWITGDLDGARATEARAAHPSGQRARVNRLLDGRSSSSCIAGGWRGEKDRAHAPGPHRIGVAH